MKLFLRSSVCCLAIVSFAAVTLAQRDEEHVHATSTSEEGLGHAHMNISCSHRVDAKFDRALALLHNFW